MGNCHRAVPLTGAMCLAVAAEIEGTLVHEAVYGTGVLSRATHEVSRPRRFKDLRLGHPSGVLPIAAGVSTRAGEPWAERVTVYRTARRLMEGAVRVP
jgi:hypothetical protein